MNFPEPVEGKTSQIITAVFTVRFLNDRKPNVIERHIFDCFSEVGLMCIFLNLRGVCSKRTNHCFDVMRM